MKLNDLKLEKVDEKPSSSFALELIFRKASKLQQQQLIAKKQNQAPPSIKIHVEHVKKTNLNIGCNRQEEFFLKRLTNSDNFRGTRKSLYQTVEKFGSRKKTQKNFHIHKVNSKSQKVFNFLSTANLKFSHIAKKENKENSPKKSEKSEEFVPIHPISRNQKAISRVSNRSKSKKMTEGSSSQKVRIQKKLTFDSPKKYLKKGERLRQILMKQLKDDEIDEQGELAYMKEYDEWVPASLLSRKKKQLDHFMNILKGSKAKERAVKQIFQPIYL